MPGARTREVTLDPGASTDTPARNHGAGASLPGPDAGHPLHGARRHRAASSGNRQPSGRYQASYLGPSHRAHTRVTAGHPVPRRRLTATVTATAAANGKRQRTAAPKDARTILANLGYATPEKQTVEDQRRPAATVANTVAKLLDGARRTWTTLEYRPSPRPVTDGLGPLAHSYGSGGCSSIASAVRPAAR